MRNKDFCSKWAGRAGGRSSSAARVPGSSNGPAGVPDGSKGPAGVPEAEGRSNCPAGGPEDNRTEILSPANEQYKGREAAGYSPSDGPSAKARSR